MLTSLLYSGLAVFLFMVVVFFLALFKKDNSVVDIAWGLGFVLVALLSLLMGKGLYERKILVTALVAVWGIRLAVYIALRKRGKGEDWRYAKWRKEWGRWFLLRSFFQIFLLQGLFLLVIIYPVVLINNSSEGGIALLDMLGIFVWLVGFFFEAVGDYQLARFKKDPQNKGQVMTGGLWKYTRHPNYFGEVVMWWGVFLIALSVPYGWTAFFSPILITVLLLRVSGVTMLEKRYEHDRNYGVYAQNTSSFFPWFPKRDR